MNTDTIIDYSISIFENLFDLKLLWDYSIIEPDTPQELVDTILMGLVEEENIIMINPQIDKLYSSIPTNLKIASIISKIGHEARHAWQDKQKLFKGKYKSYGAVGRTYINQPAEKDAYAFEEAVLKIVLHDKNAAIDFKDEEQYAKEIHTNAFLLYDEYFEKIVNLI